MPRPQPRRVPKTGKWDGISRLIDLIFILNALVDVLNALVDALNALVGVLNELVDALNCSIIIPCSR